MGKGERTTRVLRLCLGAYYRLVRSLGSHSLLSSKLRLHKHNKSRAVVDSDGELRTDR